MWTCPRGRRSSTTKRYSQSSVSTCHNLERTSATDASKFTKPDYEKLNDSASTFCNRLQSASERMTVTKPTTPSVVSPYSGSALKTRILRTTKSQLLSDKKRQTKRLESGYQTINDTVSRSVKPLCKMLPLWRTSSPIVDPASLQSRSRQNFLLWRTYASMSYGVTYGAVTFDCPSTIRSLIGGQCMRPTSPNAFGHDPDNDPALQEMLAALGWSVSSVEGPTDSVEVSHA